MIHQKYTLDAKIIFALFIAAALFFLILIRATDITSVMEARNLRSAEEIVESDNWLLPTLNGIPRILKPPLPTWAAAFMGNLAGDTRNLFFLRLPNALVTWLLILFVFLLTKALYNRRAALLSSLITLTTIQIIGEVQTARWDIFVATFGLGSLWAICQIFLVRAYRWQYLFLAIVLGAASYLSKGPVALLYSMASFLAALGIWKFFILPKGPLRSESGHEVPRHDSAHADICGRLLTLCPTGKKHWAIWIAVLVFSLVLGNVWWTTIWFRYPATWRLLREDVISVNTGHTEPFYYYLGIAPAMVAPWTLWLVLAVIWGGVVIKNWRSSHTRGQKHEDGTARRQDGTDHAQAGVLFAWIWFMVGLVMISITPAKKTRYFLNVLPAATILSGVFVDWLLGVSLKKSYEVWLRRLVTLHFWVLGSVLLLAPAGIYWLVHYGAPGTAWLLAPFPILGGVWVIGQYRTHDLYRLVLTFGIATLLTSTVIFWYLPYTPLSHSGYESAYGVKQFARGHTLYLVGDDNDKLLWGISHSYQKVVPAALVSQTWPAMLLVDESGRQECLGLLQASGRRVTELYLFKVYEHSKGDAWYLYRVE